MNTLQLNWKTNHLTKPNRGFSNYVTTAVLLSQNNETAAMLVSQTDPMGVELWSVLFFQKICTAAGHVSERPPYYSNHWDTKVSFCMLFENRKCLFARCLRIESQLFKHSVQSSTLICSLVTANRRSAWANCDFG